MTIEQMEMFITVAEHLNFTRASELLYVTQPNLSRAISSLESELNMQLFIRKSHGIRLTPAGKILYEEFSSVLDQITKGIQKASDINKGLTGNVNIGILDGTDISDFMPDLIEYFNNNFPNIKISLMSFSFRDILDGLYNEALDLVFSLEFNLQNHELITYDILENTKDTLAVHANSALFQKETLSIHDLDRENIIIISPEDLDLTEQQVFNIFKDNHIGPVFHFAPNLQTAILWLEAGIGSAFLFTRSMYAQNGKIKSFPIDTPWKTGFVIGRNSEHINPSANIVYEYCVKYFNENTTISDRSVYKYRPF